MYACYIGSASSSAVYFGPVDRRSNEEVVRSTQLKDAMRDNCLEELMNACIQLTSNLHSSNPDLAASVLEAVARYVNWIDIRLVANDRLVESSDTAEERQN